MFARGNGTAGNMTVDAVSFTLTNAMKGQAIDLTPNTGNGTTGNGTSVTIISYTDKNQHVSNVPWGVTFIGKDNGDDLLEQDEQAVIRVDLSGLNPSPATYASITIEIKPLVGASLILNRTLPAKIDAVMDLH
jgi:archaellin